MIRRPPRSTLDRSSAASDVYKRQKYQPIQKLFLSTRFIYAKKGEDDSLNYGGNPLKGSVEVSGAKNSALALMPAILLNNGENKIQNVPEVNDIFTMSKLLNQLGVNTLFKDHELILDSSNITSQTAPYEHVKKMRASVYVLGPLLTKYGYAKVSMPGGCAWGPRPINLHLEAMKKLGAEIELDEGYIIAKAKNLKGARLKFDVSSVGATGNALMAAVLAKGETIITNAAAEPEITQLAQFLVSMGAKIEGIGSNILEIQGVENLSPANVYNIPDRIEAGNGSLCARRIFSGGAQRGVLAPPARGGTADRRL